MTEKQQWKKPLLPVSTEMEASLNTADMIAVGSDAFHVKWLTNLPEAQCRIHAGFCWRKWSWPGSVSWISSKTQTHPSPAWALFCDAGNAGSCLLPSIPSCLEERQQCRTRLMCCSFHHTCTAAAWPTDCTGIPSTNTYTSTCFHC